MAAEWYYARDGERFGPVDFDELKRKAYIGLVGTDDLVWCEGMSDWEEASRIAGLLPRMATEWYYAQEGERFGPVSDVDLRQLAVAGRLHPSDLVWFEGEPDWKPAAEVPRLFHRSPAGEGAFQPKGIIRRAKEYAESDEAKAMMERAKQAASEVAGKVKDAAVGVGGKVKDVARKATDYAGSDDAKEMLGKARQNFAEVKEKVIHSEKTKAAVDFATTIPEKWQENSVVLGLPMKDWGYIAAWLGLVVVMGFASAVPPGVRAVYMLCSLWVYRDSRARLNSPVRWSIGTLVLGPLVMPAYIAVRNLKDEETREGGRAWNVLRCFALFWTITMAVVAVGAIGATSEVASAAKNDLEKAGMAIGYVIGFGFLASVWFFPMVAALVMAPFLKKSTALERGPTGALATNPPSMPLSKSTFIGIGIVGLFIIGLNSSLATKGSLAGHFRTTDRHESSATVTSGQDSAGFVAGKNGVSHADSSTVMTTGPFIYAIGHIHQLKQKYRSGFRDDAIRDMMSNDLQVANLDRPIRVTVIDRQPDYTTVRIEEDRLELAARGMHLGKRMFVPNPKNW
jgi:hypothetical protein